MKSLLAVRQTNELLLLLLLLLCRDHLGQTKRIRLLRSSRRLFNVDTFNSRWKQTGAGCQNTSVCCWIKTNRRREPRLRRKLAAARPLLLPPSNRVNSRNQIGKCISIND